MTVSSRTPEGESHQCPICGGLVNTSPSEPLGDSTCARCGSLLLELSDSLQARIRALLEDRVADEILTQYSEIDSLDTVDLVMELEGELNVEIPEAELDQARTVLDVIRLFLKYKRNREE